MRSTTCALIVCLGLGFGTLASAQSEESASSTASLDNLNPHPNSKFGGKWKMGMGGNSFSEGKDEGAAAYFRLSAKLDWQFTPWLRAYLAPRLDMYSSRLQQRFDDDAYESRLRAQDMFLSLEPIPYFSLQGGAIGQKFLDDPILISPYRAFPGFREVFSSDTKPIVVKFVAQQLIPTSYSLNAEREDKEPLPSFQTQSLHAEYKAQSLKVSGMVGHYRWAQLPSKVAFDSAIVGNSVPNAEVAPGARFAYGFDGIFWGEKFCFCGDQRLQFELNYNGEHNTAAPSEAADGQMFELGPRLIMGQRELELFYLNYFIESDATVAVYSRGSLGYANRMGDGLEAKYSFKDLGFNLQGRWINARTVADRDTQKTYTEFYLGVETEYAPF